MKAGIIERAFNVYEHEYGRTSYAWMLKFIHKIGLVAGWTTVIALFVARYGITYLPVLFMVQAAVMICGTIFYSFIVDRFEIRKVIAFTAIAAAICLVLAGFAFENEMLFFPLVIIANGFFIQQISVFLSSYIEDFFSVSEAGRVFPLIESADTFAGLLAGFLLAIPAMGVGGQKVFFIWSVLMMVMIAVTFFLHPRTSRFYSSLYEMKTASGAVRSGISGIRKGFTNIARIPFLQIIAVFFLIQWFAAQLIEYQFTKVVDEGVLSHGGEGGHAESLAHGLGMLHMLFFSSALMVQLLLASRILRFLGTVGGLFFHAVMTLMSSISMVVGLGYFTTVMAKNNFEVSGIISKNAYEASYYAFPHGTQKTIREFFEGILAPLATVTGTAALLLTALFFTEKDSLLAINIILFVMTALSVVLSYHLQKQYTALVKTNISRSGSRMAKFNSIDILEQKGHLHGAEVMASLMEHEKDPAVLSKMMKALGRIGSPESIPVIERMLDHGESEVRKTAAGVIGGMKCLLSGKKGIALKRIHIISKLKSVYRESVDQDEKIALMGALCSLEQGNVAGLIELMRKSDAMMQMECMDILCRYGEKDAMDFLKPMMYSRDEFVRAKAIMSVLAISNSDRNAREMADRMLRSGDIATKRAAYAHLWMMRQNSVQAKMIRSLKDTDPMVRLYASAGLAKLGRREAIPVLADLLLNQNNLFFGRAKYVLKGVGKGMRKRISEEMERIVMTGSGMHWMEGWSMAERLELMGEDMLLKLQKGLSVLGMEDEIELINALIDYREMSTEQRKGTQNQLSLENIIN